MRPLYSSFIAFVIVAVAYFAWHQTQKSPPPSTSDAPLDAATPNAPPANATSAPAPLSQTAAPATQPAAAPEPPVKHLTPAGTYYLVETVNISNDSGIIGVVKGTRVTLEKDNGQTLAVTDGTNHFDVNPTQVTNDLDVLAGILNANAAQSAAEASYMQQQHAAAAQNAKQYDSSVQQADAKYNKAAAVATLQGQLDQLSQQDTALAAKIEKGEKAYYSPHAEVHDAIPTWNDLVSWRQQLDQIRKNKKSVQDQITQLNLAP